MNLTLFHDGGPVFWVLCLCGLAAVAVFIERLVHLRRARIRYSDFLSGVFNILEKGKIREALSLCDEAPGPVVHLMHTAIVHRDESRDALRQILENAGRAEISRMERRLVVLSTIIQGAPLLGLLGTLLGILEMVIAMRNDIPLVHSFYITNGLVRSLICAIAGLVVAIPSYAMFNLLVIRIDRIVLDMEQATGDIMAFMNRWTSRLTSSEEK